MSDKEKLLRKIIDTLEEEAQELNPGTPYSHRSLFIKDIVDLVLSFK